MLFSLLQALVSFCLFFFPYLPILCLFLPARAGVCCDLALVFRVVGNHCLQCSVFIYLCLFIWLFAVKTKVLLVLLIPFDFIFSSSSLCTIGFIFFCCCFTGSLLVTASKERAVESAQAREIEIELPSACYSNIEAYLT